MLLTIFLPVASPSRPPKVIIGAKQAKYKKIIVAIDCNAKASLKSLRYQGALRFISLMRPPNNLYHIREKVNVKVQSPIQELKMGHKINDF